MIKIVLQILLISLPVLSFAQSLKYIVLGTTRRLPLKNAQVFSYEQRGCGMPVLELKASDDSVFSVANSVVYVVFDVGHGKSIVTKDINNEFFYSYIDLEKVTVSKGDTLRKGDLLGLLSIEDFVYGSSNFSFMITNNKGGSLGDEKAWNIIDQYNKTECNENEISFQ